MSATVETDSIKQLEKIQSMVICARYAINSVADDATGAAAILLDEADSLLRELMLPLYREVAA